jgi:hypothetical protein
MTGWFSQGFFPSAPRWHQVSGSAERMVQATQAL